MSQFTLIRKVKSPVERVFAVLTDFENAHERIPAIEKVEMLEGGPIEVGSRFRETRVIAGRRMTEELEVTRYEPGTGYAVACETRGCLFTSACLISSEGGETRIEVVLDCLPLRFMARLQVAVVMPLIRKGFEQDLDAIIDFLEAEESATGTTA